MKKDSHTTVYTVSLHLYDILEKATVGTESKAVVARCRGWEGIDGKETQETLGDDGYICVLIVMVLDTIANIRQNLKLYT